MSNPCIQIAHHYHCHESLMRCNRFECLDMCSNSFIEPSLSIATNIATALRSIAFPARRSNRNWQSISGRWKTPIEILLAECQQLFAHPENHRTHHPVVSFSSLSSNRSDLTQVDRTCKICRRELPSRLKSLYRLTIHEPKAPALVRTAATCPDLRRMPADNHHLKSACRFAPSTGNSTAQFK